MTAVRRGSPPGRLVVLLGLVMGSAAAAPSIGQAADREAGARLYHRGVLASGAEVSSTTVGEVVLQGAAAACATCHRPSGYGDTEGAFYVPPIAGPALFELGSPTRGENFRRLYQDDRAATAYARMRDPRVRPPYDLERFGRALRSGIDPASRALDPLMPRYALEDADLRNLAAYLRTLGAEPDPGVDDEEIHFATIFTPGVSEADRVDVLAVFDAYVRRKNTDVEGLLARPGHSPWHRDDFAVGYRRWVLHVWTLEGSADSWAAQLDSYADARPVFAVLGGLGGSWGPIHDFCERRSLPCLFPTTDLPGARPDDAGGGAVRYLTTGIAGEAAALGRWLAARDDVETVVQVHRDDPAGRAAARALREAWAPGRLHEVSTSVAEPLDPGRWRSAVEDPARVAWIFWLDREDIATIDPKSLPAAGMLFVSGTRVGIDLPTPLAEVRDRVVLTYPFVIPGGEPPRIYRVRAWLRSRGVRISADRPGAERRALDTYFVLSVVDHALAHMIDRFSRAYLIERVEHETENALNPGVYPRLSLGPGQRFASKGCALVRVEADGTLAPASEWIVP